MPSCYIHELPSPPWPDLPHLHHEGTRSSAGELDLGSVLLGRGIHTAEEEKWQAKTEKLEMWGHGGTTRSGRGHNVETSSSQQGSNSRQNSKVEAKEHNDGEEEVKLRLLSGCVGNTKRTKMEP